MKPDTLSRPFQQTLLLAFQLLLVMLAPIAATAQDCYQWQVVVPSVPCVTGACRLLAVTQSDDQLAAVGWELLMTSSDGVTWTEISPSGLIYPSGLPMLFLSDVAYNGSMFVAVDWAFSMLVSSDGSSWSMVEFGSEWRGITWNGSQYIAVADQGEIATSTDGVSWTDHTPSEPPWCSGLGKVTPYGERVLIAGRSSDGWGGRVALCGAGECRSRLGGDQHPTLLATPVRSI